MIPKQPKAAGGGAEDGYRLVAADPITLVVGNATPSVWKDEIAARDAEVAAFDAENPPCDGCEAPFGCDPGRCYKAPDADDDEHHDADVDARLDVTDEAVLPDGEAR